MSPAFVDFRPPATKSPIQSTNPNPYGASTSGNTNEGSFASPTVSATASGKPLRRSKPRLVKLRKSVPQQAGSTPVTETEASSSFNRFREVPTSLNQNEMQDLRDKWQGWNPFSPGSAQKTGGSNAFGASSSSAHKVGKSNDAGFVFGSNRSSLDSNSNVGKSGISESVGESIRQEMSKLNFGNQSEKKASKDFTFSFRAGSGESSIPGMFVSGNNPKKGNDFDGNGASKQQDQSGNSNNEGFQNQNNAEEPVNANFTSKGSGKNSFVFGRSDTVESLASEIPESMGKLNLKDSGDLGGSEKSKDAGPDLKSNNNTFVFGSGNSTGVHSESSSRLPDELKKLNIGGSSSDDVIRKTNETNVKASSNNVFVFASNKKPASDGAASVLHNDMQKLNIGDRLGAHTDQMNTAFSSRTSAKEAQCDPDVENPISAPSNFQSGVQGKNSVEGQAPLYQPNVENATGLDGASSSTFSSTSYHSVGNVFEMPLKDRTESKGDFSFTSTTDESGAPFPDFRTPKQDSAFASAGIFFSDLNKKLEFSAKSGATKDCKLKKRKGKRRSAMRNCGDGQAFVSRGSSSQENLESPGSYSPMDFSPYEKPLAGDQDSRETSMASDESFHLDNGFVSTNAQYSVTAEATAEPLAAEAQHLHINNDDLKCREMNGGCLKKGFDKKVGVGDPVDDSLCGTETAYFRSKMEKANMDSDASGATETTETSFSSNLEKQETDSRVPFAFASTSEDTGKTNLTFSASSSSTRGQSSATVSRHRKKNRLRVVQESYNSTLNAKFQMASSSLQFTPFPSNSSLSGAGQSKRGDSSTSESRGDIRSETEKEPGVKQGSFSTAAVPTAAQECEKWRLRGNQAYANGQSSIAEDYYTRGVNCISPNETSTNCLEALMLCYSNRAATRMALGRVREALEDCQTATAIDPNFLKVQLRAANCHLALGEIEEATKCFSICFRSAADVCLDRKLVIEASNGLQKAQQVGQHIDRSIEFLRQRKQSDAEKVLQIVAEGLSISPFSEKLIEMKAEALFMLRKYEEVIQLCELTLESAERNSIAVTSDCQLVKMDSSKSNKDSAERLWRVYLISKSYFYLGKLDEALDLLEKHTNLRTAVKKNRSKTLESLMTLAATLHELLQHKAAGNEAFQSGRYSEAVERYTAALSCNVESRPFAAICICNRGAAYQMLGQITDAIADCSLAIALDGNYLKAISRRATLHERIRDYGQAVNDLERYISLLEKQSEGKTGATGKSASRVNNLREAHQRLSSMEEKAKKGIPLDMYLILGVESTGTASDIKKAYRKSALRHHPDKAGQFLARIENGDDGLWKEIAEEIHKDADRLFKMIGEAYAVLSDPSKRSQYDLEEKIRNSHKKGGGNSERTPDVHDYPFDRSASRRQWRYAWKSYGNQQYHWS